MADETTLRGREAEARAGSTPERGSDQASCGSAWRRPAGDSKYHQGSPDARAGSFVTLCDGRWALTDSDVTVDADPPLAMRCTLCIERALERERTVLHLAVDDMLADPVALPEAFKREGVLRLAREVRRLREELESRTCELHFTQRALADAHEFIKLAATRTVQQ